MFESATHCHICSNKFNIKNEKIKDHDHFAGKFRGAACNKCNLNLKMPKFIPILIHNLKYDSKIFLRWLLKLCDEYEQKKDLNIIPKNNENYSTFSRRVIIDEYEQQYNLTKCLKCNEKYYDKILEKCPNCDENVIPNLEIFRKGDELKCTYLDGTIKYETQLYDISKCLKCNKKKKDEIWEKCPKCDNHNLHIKRKGDKFPKTMEFRFIDTLAFIGTSLEKAVKNLAEVNCCFCSKCNKVQGILKGNFLPIDENGILKYKAKCKHCENTVTKPIDYKKFKNILKEFKKEDLHLFYKKVFIHMNG